MKRLIGVVISDKMDKSRLVQITKSGHHPLYLKATKMHHKIMAHDEHNEYHLGDEVEIVQRVKVSRRKAWEIKKKVK